MRQLTARQKKLIEKACDDGILKSWSVSWEDFPSDLIDKLEKINDTEILWMEAQRYAGDYILKKDGIKWDD